MNEDPRAKKEGICGVTIIGGSGIEWICIRPVHAKIYYRHKNRKPIYSENPTADQHYMVPRWPNRSSDV